MSDISREIHHRPRGLEQASVCLLSMVSLFHDPEETNESGCVSQGREPREWQTPDGGVRFRAFLQIRERFAEWPSARYTDAPNASSDRR